MPAEVARLFKFDEIDDELEYFVDYLGNSFGVRFDPDQEVIPKSSLQLTDEMVILRFIRKHNNQIHIRTLFTKFKRSYRTKVAQPRFKLALDALLEEKLITRIQDVIRL